MATTYVHDVLKDFEVDSKAPVKESIFKQYERVIVESLITSFGLDFLVTDRHGGDVDTIHNARQIGKDPEMQYKNAGNQAAYENRGEYNSHSYHSHKGYRSKNDEVSKQRKAGTLEDGYSGKGIGRNEKSDLDHIISANEIHNDRGRVLAGMCGEDLANSPENLTPTTPNTNRSKKAKDMDTYLKDSGDKHTEEEKKLMREKDKKAREAYDKKISQEYYTSTKFAKDVSLASCHVGVQMGLRQALGLICAEIWFAIKEEFQKLRGAFDLGAFFTSLQDGIMRGFANAKAKYKEILSKFKDGFVSGVLSSISTTLCNIFFTTAKNVVNIIRQTYASIVEAVKILFLNPDNLPIGERIHAATKVLAVGASVVVGSMVSEFISKTPLGTMPVIGEIVSTFCGALVTGTMSCTLLYFLDNSDTVKKIVAFINDLLEDKFAKANKNWTKANELLDVYVAKLGNIDLKSLQEQAVKLRSLSISLTNNDTAALYSYCASAGIALQFSNSEEFDDFMLDEDSVLEI